LVRTQHLPPPAKTAPGLRNALSQLGSVPTGPARSHVAGPAVPRGEDSAAPATPFGSIPPRKTGWHTPTTRRRPWDLRCSASSWPASRTPGSRRGGGRRRAAYTNDTVMGPPHSSIPIPARRLLPGSDTERAERCPLVRSSPRADPQGYLPGAIRPMTPPCRRDSGQPGGSGHPPGVRPACGLSAPRTRDRVSWTAR